jgi:hypothetical protein
MLSMSERYIPEGFTERSFTTKDGKGKGVVYYKAYPLPDGITQYHCKGYRGKAIKPTFHYVFRSLAQMEGYIKEFFEGIEKHQEYRNEKSTENKAFKTDLKPGDVLDTCWGYDQTNREFFQVISNTDKSVILKEIAQKQIAGTGPFSATVIGLKDQFIDKEISRRVLPGNSVKIDECRYASLWNGAPVHCSWGA